MTSNSFVLSKLSQLSPSYLFDHLLVWIWIWFFSTVTVNVKVVTALLQISHQIVSCKFEKVLFKSFFDIVKLLLKDKVVVELSHIMLSQTMTCKWGYFFNKLVWSLQLKAFYQIMGKFTQTNIVYKISYWPLTTF